MKVIITGGAGFIGSHIVELLLKQGDTPIVVDNFSTGDRRNVPPSVTVYEADICESAELRKIFEHERPDAVCHQAAQMSVGRSVQEPSFDSRVNILGLVQTLEAAVACSVKRFVFASSGGVLYGDVQEPADENFPARPISPYGISKWAGEQYLQFFSREFGLETVALRYSNVYGPRQNPHGEAGVVAIFCRRMLSGQSVTINGDGKYFRDYVYVADVAEANRLALSHQLPQKFIPLNVGTGRGCDVNELHQYLSSFVQATLQQSGLATTVGLAEYGPARPGDLRSNLVNATRLTELWGWQPRFDLQAGLAATVRWFDENRRTEQ